MKVFAFIISAHLSDVSEKMMHKLSRLEMEKNRLEMENYRLELLGIRSLTHIGVFNQINSQYGFVLNPNAVLQCLLDVATETANGIWEIVQNQLTVPNAASDKSTYQSKMQKLLEKTVAELKKRYFFEEPSYFLEIILYLFSNTS